LLGGVVSAFDGHAKIIKGLPVSQVKTTAASLGLKPDAFIGRIGLSRATYNRKRNRAKSALGPLISDALSRYQSLIAQAVTTFDGDENSARQWLTSSQPGLAGAIPIEMARSTLGYREVEKLLTRIDRGVYA
jgi:putative toxin-antitoxin system antitoxin component (TIGR02293 family)